MAYHFLNKPYNDLATSTPSRSTRIPAQEVLHYFMQERPGQSHGIPVLAPVMKRLRDLGEYEDWELFAARVQACISVLITRESTDDIGLNKSSGDDGLDANLNPESLFEPGMTFQGRPGESLTGFCAYKTRQCIRAVRHPATAWSRLRYEPVVGGGVA